VVIWDQAGFHPRPEDGQLPARIHLLPLPPYSPELNPLEGLWDQTQDVTCNQRFTSLDHLEEVLTTWRRSSRKRYARFGNRPDGSYRWFTTGFILEQTLSPNPCYRKLIRIDISLPTTKLPSPLLVQLTRDLPLNPKATHSLVQVQVSVLQD